MAERSTIIGQSHTDETVQLLFLSVEHAGMPEVQAFVQSLHSQGRLSRIVIDECHLALSWSDFRPSMFSLKGLRMFPVSASLEIGKGVTKNFRPIRVESQLG
jgi:superfamily II DNA helicase RecQ